MLSYMVLCGSLRQVLPGTRTIPEQISEDKGPYYAALEAADECYKRGQVDVSKMEKLLEDYLAVQLVEIHDQANGRANTASADLPTNAVPKQNGFIASIESKPVLIGAAVAIVLAVLGLFFG
jgi:hypothetical protein